MSLRAPTGEHLAYGHHTYINGRGEGGERAAICLVRRVLRAAHAREELPDREKAGRNDLDVPLRERRLYQAMRRMAAMTAGGRNLNVVGRGGVDRQCECGCGRGGVAPSDSGLGSIEVRVAGGDSHFEFVLRAP